MFSYCSDIILYIILNSYSYFLNPLGNVRFMAWCVRRLIKGHLNSLTVTQWCHCFLSGLSTAFFSQHALCMSFLVSFPLTFPSLSLYVLHLCPCGLSLHSLISLRIDLHYCTLSFTCDISFFLLHPANFLFAHSTSYPLPHFRLFLLPLRCRMLWAMSCHGSILSLSSSSAPFSFSIWFWGCWAGKMSSCCHVCTCLYVYYL